MRKGIIFVVCLAICVIGIGVYIFWCSDVNKQEQEKKEESIQEVNISNVYSIPQSTHQTNTNNVFQSTSNSNGQMTHENESINKKPLTVQEKKTNIVNKSFISTSKDIATF